MQLERREKQRTKRMLGDELRVCKDFAFRASTIFRDSNVVLGSSGG